MSSAAPTNAAAAAAAPAAAINDTQKNKNTNNNNDDHTHTGHASNGGDVRKQLVDSSLTDVSHSDVDPKDSTSGGLSASSYPSLTHTSMIENSYLGLTESPPILPRGIAVPNSTGPTSLEETQTNMGMFSPGVANQMGLTSSFANVTSPYGSPSGGSALGFSPGMFMSSGHTPGPGDVKSISRYRVLQPPVGLTGGVGGASSAIGGPADSTIHDQTNTIGPMAHAANSTPSMTTHGLYSPGQQSFLAAPQTSRYDLSPGSSTHTLARGAGNLMMPLTTPPTNVMSLSQRQGLPPLPPAGGSSMIHHSPGLSGPSASSPSSANQISSPSHHQHATLQQQQQHTQHQESALSNSMQHTKQLMAALSSVQIQSQQQQQQHLQSQQQVNQLQLQLQLQMRLSQQLQQQLQLQQQQLQAGNTQLSLGSTPSYPSGPSSQSPYMPYQPISPPLQTKHLAPNSSGFTMPTGNSMPLDPNTASFDSNIYKQTHHQTPPQQHHQMQHLTHTPHQHHPTHTQQQQQQATPGPSISPPPPTSAAKPKKPLKVEKSDSMANGGAGAGASALPSTNGTGTPAPTASSKKRERSSIRVSTGDDDDGDDDDDASDPDHEEPGEESSDNSDHGDEGDDGPPELDADGNVIKKKRIAGSSCHQCKTRRVGDELIYCGMSHAKKGRAKKKKAERKCRKKYCARCLMKFYTELPPPKLAPGEVNHWSCPGCRGLCTCAACKRTQARRENKRKKLAQQQNGGPNGMHQQQLYGGMMGNIPYEQMTLQQVQQLQQHLQQQGGLPYSQAGPPPLMDVMGGGITAPGMTTGPMGPQTQMGQYHNAGLSPTQQYAQGPYGPPTTHSMTPHINPNMYGQQQTMHSPMGGNATYQNYMPPPPPGAPPSAYGSPPYQNQLYPSSGLGYRSLSTPGSGPPPNMSYPPTTPTMGTHSLMHPGANYKLSPSAYGRSLDPTIMPSPVVGHSSIMQHQQHHQHHQQGGPVGHADINARADLL